MCNGTISNQGPRVDFVMPMASIKDASIKLKISEVKPVEHSSVATRQNLFKK